MTTWHPRFESGPTAVQAQLGSSTSLQEPPVQANLGELVDECSQRIQAVFSGSPLAKINILPQQERQLAALTLALLVTAEIVRWKDRRKEIGKMSKDEVDLLLHALRQVEIQLTSTIRLGDFERLSRCKAEYEQILIARGWSRGQAETAVDCAIGQIMQVIAGRTMTAPQPVTSESRGDRGYRLAGARSTRELHVWALSQASAYGPIVAGPEPVDSIQYDIFLSHASADVAPALTLFHLLNRRCRVFLAGASMEPGAQWRAELVNALDRSRIMVVLVSSHSDQAYFQTEEILRMIGLARADTTRSIVPVFLDSGESSDLQIPFGLAGWQGIRLSNANGMEGVSERLLDMMRSAHP